MDNWYNGHRLIKIPGGATNAPGLAIRHRRSGMQVNATKVCSSCRRELPRESFRRVRPSNPQKSDIQASCNDCFNSQKLHAKVIAGTRFGMWVVTEDRSGHSRTVMCRCDCGNERLVFLSHLRRGNSLSCGCVNRSENPKRDNPAYAVWACMIQRCTNPKNSNYHKYGGRGITVCSRWRDSFDAFIQDVGDRPDGTSLDRIDNNGNYDPSNVRWATPIVQARNMRKNRLATIGEQTKTVTEWISILGIESAPCVWSRLRRGWSEVDALLTPIGVDRVERTPL